MFYFLLLYKVLQEAVLANSLRDRIAERLAICLGKTYIDLVLYVLPFLKEIYATILTFLNFNFPFLICTPFCDNNFAFHFHLFELCPWLSPKDSNISFCTLE